MTIWQIAQLAWFVFRTLNSLSGDVQAKTAKKVEDCCKEAEKRGGRWTDDFDGT